MRSTSSTPFGGTAGTRSLLRIALGSVRGRLHGLVCAVRPSRMPDTPRFGRPARPRIRLTALRLGNAQQAPRSPARRRGRGGSPRASPRLRTRRAGAASGPSIGTRTSSRPAARAASSLASRPATGRTRPRASMAPVAAWPGGPGWPEARRTRSRARGRPRDGPSMWGTPGTCQTISRSAGSARYLRRRRLAVAAATACSAASSAASSQRPAQTIRPCPGASRTCTRSSAGRAPPAWASTSRIGMRRGSPWARWRRDSRAGEGGVRASSRSVSAARHSSPSRSSAACSSTRGARRARAVARSSSPAVRARTYSMSWAPRGASARITTGGGFGRRATAGTAPR